jgi:hypothetical protein
MDQASGGYPWKDTFRANPWESAKLFDTQEKAERWAAVFTNSSWYLRAVKVTISYEISDVIPTEPEVKAGKHEKF